MVKTFEAKKGKWVSNFLKIEKYEVAIRFPLYFLMVEEAAKCLCSRFSETRFLLKKMNG